MAKPMQEYDRFQRRVAKVISNLKDALTAHRQWALRVKPRSEVRYMLGDLAYIKGQIELAVRFVTAAPEGNSTAKKKGAKE